MKNSKKIQVAALSFVTVFTILGTSLIPLTVENVKANPVEIEVKEIDLNGQKINIVEEEKLVKEGLRTSKYEFSEEEYLNLSTNLEKNIEKFKENTAEKRGNIEVLNYLGISAIEAREYYSKGISFKEIALEKNLSVDELKNIFIDQLINKLDQALENEQITQNQYNKLRDNQDLIAESFLNGDFEIFKNQNPYRSMNLKSMINN